MYIKDRNEVVSLSYLVATRRKFLSFWKKHSTKWRSLYKSTSNFQGFFVLDFGGIAYDAPCEPIYPLILFVPYALSPSTVLPSIGRYERTARASWQSFMFPGVSIKCSGFPSASTAAWIFVVFPPLLVPMAWLFSPPVAFFLPLRHAGALLWKWNQYL